MWIVMMIMVDCEVPVYVMSQNDKQDLRAEHSEEWEVYPQELFPPDDPPRPSRPKNSLGLVMIMMVVVVVVVMMMMIF